MKIRLKTINNIQDSVYIQEKFVNNSKDCLYYGPQHGLFHPTVEHPRFIITGGAGFIGSHLVKRLRQQYKARQIKVLDNLWRGHLYNLQFENGTWAISIALDFCLVDLRNTNDALKFLTGADVIFHLASIVAGINYLFSHQLSVFRNNLLINSNTIHAAKTNKVQKFIYVGTAYSFSKFLRDASDTHSLKEEEQTYSMESELSQDWSKLMGEDEAELAKSDVFKVGILRLHNVYGPYSDYSATTGQVIPSLIRKALNYKNETLIVWGSGKQYRDFIYVDDVVDSLILILERGMNKEAIQIGTAKATSIKDLAQVVSQLVEVKLQRKIDLTFDNTQPEDDRGHIANLDRAKSILKWQPKIDIKDGISTTVSWIAKNREKQRVLVIVIGQVRGGDLAWKSLHKFLLRPLDAHLALCVPESQTRTYLHNISQYIWTTPEYDDWGVVLDMATKACNIDGILRKWLNYCKIPGIFMGGLANCSKTGSGGILYAFRWLVQQKILELNLLDKYDWFILTRADELHLCHHHDFFSMNESHILLPIGEYYDGWSDRYIIAKSSVFIRMMNITTELMCKPDYWFEILKRYGGEYNTERIQKVLWSYMNIPISEFNRSMFTVRTQHDPTRWSHAYDHPAVAMFDLKLKYPAEYELSIRYCNVKNVTNALEVIKQYHSE